MIHCEMRCRVAEIVRDRWIHQVMSNHPFDGLRVVLGYSLSTCHNG